MVVLEKVLGQSAVSFTDLQTGRTTISVYFPQKPAWSALGNTVRSELRLLGQAGVRVGSRRVTCQAIAAENWAESWKRHFPVLRFKGGLVVQPSWSRRRPRVGETVVVLDPGLSFGTGQHPTTGFCLEQITQWRQPSQPQSFLDAGTGSGILAIAAARLGYQPIHAFDNDPDALRIARVNARRNRLSGAILFRQQDFTRLPRVPEREYDLICANLLANLLIEKRDVIITRLSACGLLVLAGILDVEYARVRRAYEGMGLKPVASRREGEWRSGSFAWQ